MFPQNPNTMGEILIFGEMYKFPLMPKIKSSGTAKHSY